MGAELRGQLESLGDLLPNTDCCVSVAGAARPVGIEGRGPLLRVSFPW